MDQTTIQSISEEIERFRDITPVNIEGFEDPSKKLIAFLKTVALTVDADFYFKVVSQILRVGLQIQGSVEF